MTSSIGIKRYGISGVRKLLASWGEPKFRADQLISWLYQKQATNYNEMTNINKSLRERLCAEEPLYETRVLNKQTSSDGTRKYLIQLADGCSVETVGIPESGRLTVCFSTQVGCAMRCAFCTTGTRGLTRSLSPGEMADQLIVVTKDFGTRITNAVAMGEGEPFANYENTLEALKIMNSPLGLGIGARHLTISTCGLLKPIVRFANESQQFTLAVSLHSAVQPTRNKLVPALIDQPLAELRVALLEYAKLTGRRPSLEVVLIKDITDTEVEIEALVGFAQGMLCHVNLIPFNYLNKNETVEQSCGERSSRAYDKGKESGEFYATLPKRCKEIADRLKRAGIECSVRRSRGTDIAAACGQLKGIIGA